MELSRLKQEIMSLPSEQRELLIKEASRTLEGVPRAQASRRHLLDNRMGECPHCGHGRYVRFGKDKGAQRYKCKGCCRSFTEYTGTWMAGLHKKGKVDAYLALMVEEKSLDKIKDALGINKKTAFDWRHKVLSSLADADKDDFTGITESDETFFLDSEKGSRNISRDPRKRGGAASKRGVNDEHVAVIVTRDRNSALDMTVATMGRIGKADIENAIGGRIKKGKAVLCSDAHVSYKGFAMDNQLEHHALKGAIKQRVKQGVCHIQHVNSTHNRVKKWIDGTFWGVATKYLQGYMDWFRIKEKFKGRGELLPNMVTLTVRDTGAQQRYREIRPRYQMLISMQN